jgi:hypothetical protein
MSEANPHVTPEEPAAAPRVQAMFRSLGVSVAQVATAAVIAYGCWTATSILPRDPGPADMADGVPYVLAVIVLVPLGAMIVGLLVAQKLRLANWGAYSLSIIVVFVVFLANGGSGNYQIVFLVPTAVNLLIALSAGMQRDRLRRS